MLTPQSMRTVLSRKDKLENHLEVAERRKAVEMMVRGGMRCPSGPWSGVLADPVDAVCPCAGAELEANTPVQVVTPMQK